MNYIYESKLSEHIITDNIGQLICLDVPIARSGSQDYLEDEVNGNGSNRIVKLQRPWKVVKASAPSFEGKPFLKLHPDEDITIANIKEHQVGHVQNVRANDQDEMLIADIVVSDADIIELIKTKKMREISCGYFYDMDDNYTVTSIVGEHVALVPEGRAGNTKILDAAIQPFDTFLTETSVEEIQVGDWIYTSLVTGGNLEFAEVIRIIKNGEDHLLLLSNHVEKPRAVTLHKDEKVRGLLKDVKKVAYKEPTEEQLKKEISTKLEGKAEGKAEDAAPEEEDLYIYAIYAKVKGAPVLRGWIGLDKEGREGIVSNRSLAAIFTTPKWREELTEDHASMVRELIGESGFIRAQAFNSWLD